MQGMRFPFSNGVLVVVIEFDFPLSQGAVFELLAPDLVWVRVVPVDLHGRLLGLVGFVRVPPVPHLAPLLLDLVIGLGVGLAKSTPERGGETCALQMTTRACHPGADDGPESHGRKTVRWAEESLAAGTADGEEQGRTWTWPWPWWWWWRRRPNASKQRW